jgi:hypothetical protein
MVGVIGRVMVISPLLDVSLSAIEGGEFGIPNGSGSYSMFCTCSRELHLRC